jgi:uncharacterized Zn-binding protein involved in type VI secretion
MGKAAIVGTTAGPFVLGMTTIPIVSITSGSTKVRFEGRGVATLTGHRTDIGGQLSGVSSATTKVRVEGQPVILSGASCSLSNGAVGGVVGVGTTKVSVS